MISEDVQKSSEVLGMSNSDFPTNIRRFWESAIIHLTLSYLEDWLRFISAVTIGWGLGIFLGY